LWVYLVMITFSLPYTPSSRFPESVGSGCSTNTPLRWAALFRQLFNTGKLFLISAMALLFLPRAGAQADTLLIDSTICNGLTFTLPNGENYDYQPGLNEETIWIEEGADSILLQLSLQVDPFVHTAAQYRLCEGDTAYYNGQAVTQDTVIQILVSDPDGCDSLYFYQYLFIEPAFIYYTPFPEAICPDDRLEYKYGIDFISNLTDPYIFINESPAAISDFEAVERFMPITAFPEDTKIEQSEDIEVCVNIEHSWMHDLQVELLVPDGTVIPLQQQETIPNEVWLGEPIEEDIPYLPGMGFTYCWDMVSERGTWNEFASENGTDLSTPYVLPSGTYTPSESFASLVGKPWNGEWGLRITDFWSSDNGGLFYWSIRQKNSDTDTTTAGIQRFWTAEVGSIAGDLLTLSPLQQLAGPHEFSFTVQDTSLGCGHSVIFSTLVIPAGPINRDTVLCPGAVLLDRIITEEGTYTFQLESERCSTSAVYNVEFYENAPTDTITGTSCRYAEAGIFYETIPLENAVCDSFVVYDITFDSPADTVFTEIFTCHPELVGTRLDTISVNGCDAIQKTVYVYEEPTYELPLQPDSCGYGLGMASILWPTDTPYEFFDATWFDGQSAFATGPEAEALAGDQAYVVEINAGSACTISDTFFLENTGVFPEINTASIQDSIAGTTVFFDLEAEFGQTELTWTWPDGSETEGLSSSYNFGFPGAYSLQLRTENLCGTDTAETTYILPPTVKVEQNQFVVQGDTLLIPLLFDGARNLSGLVCRLTSGADWQLAQLSPSGKLSSLGTPEEVQTGDTLQLSWTGTLPSDFLPGDTLAVLALQQTTTSEASFGQVEVSASYLPENDILPTPFFPFRKGELTFQLSQITGRVVASPPIDSEVAGIEDVLIRANANNRSLTALSSAEGTFSLNGHYPDQASSLSARKADSTTTGLSTGDLLRLTRHLDGTEEITDPYQLLAADIDCSAGIDSLDLDRLQEVLMEGTDTFSQCPGWIFVPQSHIFSYPTAPFSYPDTLFFNTLTGPTLVDTLLGIRRGDLLKPEGTGGADTLFLLIEAENYEAGAMADIPFLAQQFEGYTGFQLEIRFDPTMLQLQSYTFGNLPFFDEDNVGISQAEQGCIRINWYNPEGQPLSLLDGTSVFTLTFQLLQDVDNLQSYLSLKESSPLRAEGYDIEGRTSPLILLYDLTNSASALFHEGFRLWPPEPNPFNTETFLPFYLPSSTNVEIRWIDINGRILQKEESHYTAGMHRYRLTSRDKLRSGVYYLVFSTPFGTQSQKVVLLR